jgi:alpha-tubulin suppressor-like RCC1 family protein
VLGYVRNLLTSLADNLNLPYLNKIDLMKWPIFSLLEPEFACKIKMACVYGNLGNEAIVVTKNNEVFATGSNAAGCLGLRDLQSTLIPKKVKALCSKGVKGFAYGSGPHVIAFTETGEVYSWGHNGYSELGNGSSTQCLFPTVIGSSLSGKEVIEVACGSHHSLALTRDGEVRCCSILYTEHTAQDEFLLCDTHPVFRVKVLQKRSSSLDKYGVLCSELKIVISTSLLGVVMQSTTE